MTSFDARLAQIRRRGEKLRKQKKRQRRLFLMTCVPVMLCICVIALWQFNPRKPHAEGDGSHADIGDMTLLSSPLGATVTCGDHVFTDPEQVDQILIWVQTVTAPRPPQQVVPEANIPPTEDTSQTHQYDDMTETPEDLDNFGSVSDSSSAPITFTVQEEGTTTVYALTPAYLTNTQTGEQYPISQKQYEMFMEWML